MFQLCPLTNIFFTCIKLKLFGIVSLSRIGKWQICLWLDWTVQKILHYGNLTWYYAQFFEPFSIFFSGEVSSEPSKLAKSFPKSFIFSSIVNSLTWDCFHSGFYPRFSKHASYWNTRRFYLLKSYAFSVLLYNSWVVTISVWIVCMLQPSKYLVLITLI